MDDPTTRVAGKPIAMPNPPDDSPDNPADLPQFYRPKDLAEAFGCTGRTLRNWRRAGLLTPFYVGRSVYYTEDDVRRMIESGRQNPPSPSTG